MKKTLNPYSKNLNKLINLTKSLNDKGFFHVFVANIFFVLAAFGSQLFIAAVLTDIELGYIKIFQSYIQILSILAGLGYSTSVLVICSNPKNKQRNFEVLQVAIFTIIPASFFILILFLFLNHLDLLTNVTEVKQYFTKYSFAIIFTVISATLTAFIQSQRVFKKFSIVIVITKILSIVFIVILTYFYGLEGFFHGLWIGLLFSLIINIIFTKRYFKVSFSNKISNYLVKAYDQLKIGVHGLGANLFGILASNLDIILMGFLISDEMDMLGQYSFASIFFTGLGILQSTIGQIASPYFGKHINDRAATIFLIKKYNKILFLMSVLLLICLYFILPEFILLVYGDKYLIGVSFLTLLLGVWFFKVNNSINGSFLLASGNVRYINLINLINAILSGIAIFISLEYYNIRIMIFLLMAINLFILLLSFYLVRITIGTKLIKKDEQ